MSRCEALAPLCLAALLAASAQASPASSDGAGSDGGVASPDEAAADGGLASADDAGAGDAGAGDARPSITRWISGLVRARGSRRPIPGADLLEADGGLLVEADAEGRFKLGLRSSDARIQVVAGGFRSKEFDEHLEDHQAVEVVYSLEPLETNPFQTVVRGERDRTEVSRITLEGAELHEVAGTQGDPLRVVMLMPGVATVMSGISYPVVRGTVPAATGTYLDGVAVPQLYHLLLGPEVVQPDFIEGVDFYPGLAPAAFPGNLGGVINGRIASAHDDQLHATAYADLINGGALVELPIPATGTNLTVGGRYAYGAKLAAGGINAITSPDQNQHRASLFDNFYDLQARLEQKVGGGKLRVLALGSSDSLGLDDPDAPPTSAAYSLAFVRADARYQHPLGPGEAEVGLTVGTERDGIDFTQSSAPSGTFAAQDQAVTLRARYGAPTPIGLIGVGAEAGPQWADFTLSTTDNALLEPATNHQGPLGSPTRRGFTSSIYANDSLQLGARWLVLGGVRLEDYHLTPGIDRLGVEPQGGVRFAVTPTVTLRAGSGLMRQPPTTFIALPLISLAALNLGLQSAWQNELGVEWRPVAGWEVAATAYVDWMPRTIVLPFQDLMQSPYVLSLAERDPSAPGRAYGAELMVRKSLGGRWFGWVSYAYQHSEQLVDFARFDASGTYQGEGRGWVPFAFEEQHVLAATLSVRLPVGFTVGASLAFNTGRPESGDLTSADERPVTNSAGATVWVPVQLDQVDRLPSFFRVDARVAKVWLFDAFSLEAYLDVLDASLSQQTLAYTYPSTIGPPGASTPNVRQPLEVPLVVPMLGVKATY